MADTSKPVYKLEIGDPAPDFTLIGTEGGAGRGKGYREYKLSEWRGKNVVLAFVPAAFTPV
ncbi:MAG TPA: alkyl hydroperoxide reductase [Myxococcales bacterium]|jgi:peroxiredoxin|nr:alkyl hydroperoxide reductase [Myxococcales bacterium]